MQLPHSKARQDYIDQVKIIEANLKEATSGKKDEALLSMVQKRLDSLAEKYQYSEEIDTAKYKLYELQALVHYFNGHDDDALDFITQAIETRGETYAKAEKLKKRLSLGDSYLSETTDPDKMTKEQLRSQKIGLEGWLALFTVGVILSVILCLIAAGLWLYSLTNLSNTADDFAAGLLGSYYSFSMVMSLAMAFLAAWLLFLLFKRKRLARWVGISLLSLSILSSFIDYTWYADLTVQVSGLGPQRGDASVIWAIIWIIYLCVSKRVKRTLTK